MEATPSGEALPGMYVKAAPWWPLLSPPEEYGEVGFNYRMTDLQAAVGLVQLGRIAEVVGVQIRQGVVGGVFGGCVGPC